MRDTPEMRARASTGRAWVFFASLLLVVGGILNIVTGVSALHDRREFTLQLLYHNLTVWGWVFVLWGAVEITAGVLAYSGRALGSYIGIIVAVLAQSTWFFFLFAAPFSAIAGIAINLLILYGLTIGAGDRSVFD